MRENYLKKVNTGLDRLSAEILHHSEMRGHRTRHSCIHIIRKVIFLTGVGHDFTDAGVMNVADPREQVMFYLVIQTSDKP